MRIGELIYAGRTLFEWQERCKNSDPHPKLVNCESCGFSATTGLKWCIFINATGRFLDLEVTLPNNQRDAQ